MANDFKNTSLVAKWAVDEFLNVLMLAGKVDRQLDEKNVFNKVGATVNVRRPVMFTASDGAIIDAGEVSDIEEAIVPVVLDTRKKVVFQIDSQDMTLKIEDANERYIKPAMVELAQQVESAIAAQYYQIPAIVGTPATTPATQSVVNAAKQKLDEFGVPFDMRSAFYDPAASNALAAALSSVFPQDIARRAIEKAAIAQYSGFDIFMNQSLKTHTTGTFTTASTPLVNGATQNVTYNTAKDTDSQTLITDGWAASTLVLTQGDIFTLAGVFAVNRRTRESTGVLQQFTTLADATSDGSGDLTVTIAPPIITSGPYQTCTAAPANDAVITPFGVEATPYKRNMAFHKNCITLATAQLDLPTDGASSARESLDNISIRVVRQYNSTIDATTMRFDILFGVKVQNRSFGVLTTD